MYVVGPVRNSGYWFTHTRATLKDDGLWYGELDDESLQPEVPAGGWEQIGTRGFLNSSSCIRALESWIDDWDADGDHTPHRPQELPQSPEEQARAAILASIKANGHSAHVMGGIKSYLTFKNNFGIVEFAGVKGSWLVDHWAYIDGKSVVLTVERPFDTDEDAMNYALMLLDDADKQRLIEDEEARSDDDYATSKFYRGE